MTQLNNIKRVKKITVCLGVIVVISGWLSMANLKAATPASSYHSPAAQIAADTTNGMDMTASVNNVKVTINENEWPGDAGVTEDVTPVKVTIRNNGDEPIFVNYDLFSIVTQGGKIHGAIPPFKVNGKVNKYELGVDYGVIVPDFDYSNFYVAPYYDSLYNDIDPYNDYVYYNWPYYSGYYVYWDNAQTDLPTATMLSYALPEGVIKPGGFVSGYIYFEKIKPEKVSEATFQYDLKNPGFGYKWGQITIPVSVSNLSNVMPY